jgi:CDP-4-dehydro-6-deoxyglucose reductase
MPDPKFTQPWHGVPRDDIDWRPILDDDLCNGCGVCVTGCGRGVFGCDYEREKAVVVEPLHCMVGCVTCANVCLRGAVSFPPLDGLRKLMEARGVLATARRELAEGRSRLALRQRE